MPKINVVCLALQGKTVGKLFLAQQHLVPIGKQGLRNHLEKLRDGQARPALSRYWGIIRNVPSPCLAPPTAERRQMGRLSALLHRLIVCVARLLGPRQAYCPLLGRIPGEFSLALRRCSSAPMDFPSSSAKSCLWGFWLNNRKFEFRNRSGFNRFYRLGKAVTLCRTETGAVHSTDDLLDRIIKVIGGSQHIGHIQGLCPALGGVAGAECAPKICSTSTLDWFCWQGKPEYRRTGSPSLLSAR